MRFAFAVPRPVNTSRPKSYEGGATQRPHHGAGYPLNLLRTEGLWGIYLLLFYSFYNINSIFKLHMNTVTAPPGRAAACSGRPSHFG